MMVTRKHVEGSPSLLALTAVLLLLAGQSVPAGSFVVPSPHSGVFLSALHTDPTPQQPTLPPKNDCSCFDHLYARPTKLYQSTTTTAAGGAVSANTPQETSSRTVRAAAARGSMDNAASKKSKCVLEGVDWDWIGLAKSVFEGSDKRPVILFDGVCNLCNGGVNFALDNDDVGNFRFVSLQSKVGKSLLLRCGKSPNDISSIVLVTGDGLAHYKSDAILRIARGLSANPLLPAFGWVGPVVPPVIRNWVYDVVARNRYRLGERASPSCRMDFDGVYESRFIEDPTEE